ncbi:MAG: hypothetical protein ACHQ6U_08495 [Thermodesulfobacteriota bacterium]
MDFVSESVSNGRHIRTLNVVDNFSRECLAIHVDHSIRAEKVVRYNVGIEAFHGEGPGEDAVR